MIQDESKNKNAREEDENPMLRAVYSALGGQGNERNYAQTLELKVPIYAVGDVNMDDVMRRSEILPYRPREEWGNLVYRPKRNKLIEQMLGPIGVDDDEGNRMQQDSIARLRAASAKKAVDPADLIKLCSENSTAQEAPRSEAEKKQEPNVVTRFDEGVETALKQVGLSWKYMYKNLQKKLSKDENKQKELDKEIEAISQEYETLPTTKGMAQLGSVGANIVGVALPTVIAGAVLSAPGAAIVGGGLTTLGMAETASQANLEMDSFERKTGKKLTENQRAAYTAATVATESIMNVVMNAKVFKNISPGMSTELKSRLKDALIKNPIAQQEFNTMTRQVIKNEMQQLPEVIGRQAMVSGAEGAVSSGALEGAKSIYTGEAPELERVVTSVLGGFAAGMVQGATSGATTPLFNHNNRMKKDDVYYVSRMQEGTKNQLPISEIDIKDVDDIGKRTYVKGNVMPSTGGAPKEDVFDARVVSGGSYREAFNQGAVTDKMDGWSIPKERMDEYERMWSKARKATSKKEADRMRNEVVQGIAADMGVPITVYPSLKEVPKTLKKYGETFVSGAVTADHAGIYVILDRCRNLTAENMASVLRHEAAGHFGLRKLYDSPEAYQADLMQLGEAAFKKKIDYEEKISREAENRETYQAGSEDENLNKVYNLLQNSESNLRNSTVNELRNLHRRRELDYMFRDGYPLPSMYHIEQQRKRMP